MFEFADFRTICASVITRLIAELKNEIPNTRMIEASAQLIGGLAKQAEMKNSSDSFFTVKEIAELKSVLIDRILTEMVMELPNTKLLEAVAQLIGSLSKLQPKEPVEADAMSNLWQLAEMLKEDTHEEEVRGETTEDSDSTPEITGFFAEDVYP